MKGEDDMKKKLGLAIGGIVAAGILGLGIFYSGASEAEAAMTTDEIKGVVEKQYPGDITDVKQDTEFNRAVYEVEVSGDKKQYSLKLDGDTGDVLDIQEKSVQNPDKTLTDEEKKENKGKKAKEKESKSHKKENKTEKNTTKTVKDEEQKENKAEQAKEKESKFHKKENKKENNKTQQAEQKNTVISEQEARKIALKEFSGTSDDIELDEEDRRLIYAIEI